MALVDAEAVLTTNNWTNTTGGKWETAGNWSAVAPDTADAINLITNAPTKFITMDALSVGNETISNLVIRGPAGTLNTLRITNALDRSAGDPSGNFTTNNVAIFTVTNTVGTVTNYLDVGAATNVPAFFYRVRLVP
jgi:hypothetical protein